MDRYQIDGTSCGDHWGLIWYQDSGGTHAPYAIFDIVEQRWPIMGIRWLWLAKLWLHWYERKEMT